MAEPTKLWPNKRLSDHLATGLQDQRDEGSINTVIADQFHGNDTYGETNGNRVDIQGKREGNPLGSVINNPVSSVHT
jgi:hypothetical protein